MVRGDWPSELDAGFARIVRLAVNLVEAVNACGRRLSCPSPWGPEESVHFTASSKLGILLLPLASRHPPR